MLNLVKSKSFCNKLDSFKLILNTLPILLLKWRYFMSFPLPLKIKWSTCSLSLLAYKCCILFSSSISAHGDFITRKNKRVRTEISPSFNAPQNTSARVSISIYLLNLWEGIYECERSSDFSSLTNPSGNHILPNVQLILPFQERDYIFPQTPLLPRSAQLVDPHFSVKLVCRREEFEILP